MWVKRADAAHAADLGVAAQDGAGIDHGVLADLDVGVDVGGLGVADGDAGDHQALEHALVEDALGGGELGAVIDAQDLF